MVLQDSETIMQRERQYHCHKCAGTFTYKDGCAFIEYGKGYFWYCYKCQQDYLEENK